MWWRPQNLVFNEDERKQYYKSTEHPDSLKKILGHRNVKELVEMKFTIHKMANTPALDSLNTITYSFAPEVTKSIHSILEVYMPTYSDIKYTGDTIQNYRKGNFTLGPITDYDIETSEKRIIELYKDRKHILHPWLKRYMYEHKIWDKYNEE